MILLTYAIWAYFIIGFGRAIVLGVMEAEEPFLIWKDEGFYDYSGGDTDISMAAMWMSMDE